MFQAQHKKPRGFNKKPAQRAQDENKITLTARHERQLKQFEQQQTKTLPIKEKQLAVTEKQIEKLREIKKKRGRLNAVENEQLFELRKERKGLIEEIDRLKTRDEENDYLLKTATVVAEYTSDESGGNSNSLSSATSTSLSVASSSSIAAFLSGGGPPATTGSDSAQPQLTLKNWMRGERRIAQSAKDRKELLEAYCAKTIPNYVASKPFCHEQPNKCPDPECGAVNEVVNTVNGRVNCARCGTEIDVTFAARHTSFKETKTTELVPEFPYKRINHFKEWLSQIQGKQNTEIVEKVFTGLESEFKKHERFKENYKGLTPKFVKQCLQKLGFTKYYEHAEYIIHHFNGLPPPVLTVETEEEFIEMFREIQIPFAMCKPQKRKNFLSYSYIFHQFAMLTAEDQLLDHFPLLKDRQKLKKQDDIWKGMCKILRWEFIATV